MIVRVHVSGDRLNAHSSHTSPNRVSFLRRRWIATALSLVLGAGQTAVGQDAPASWGNLSAGPYPVGFRTIFAYDLARPSVPYSDWDGRLYPTGEKPGRQMQINIWYPAETTATDQALAFGHYLDLMARQTDFAPIDQDKRRFANGQFVEKTNALGGNGSFTLEKLDMLRKLATAAHAEADPVPGKFPLIVFPNGGSPAFQSIMSEFFASHGFVVAAGALKGRHGSTEEISARGIETAVDDLGFLIGEVLKTEQADPEKICLIGNAITSSHIVAYQARNSRIDCLVSLDGGLLSQFEQKLLRQTAYYDAQEVNKPLLAIYAPHPSIDPQYIDHLRFSRRFLFHFLQMSEFHFLNFGAFERFVPGIIGEPGGDVTGGFEAAATICLRFFEAFLQDNRESERYLSTSPSPAISDHIDKVAVLEALPSPPGTAVLKDGFLNHGFAYIDDVYERLKERNPTPFSRSLYSELKDWLAWKKDPGFENRYQLYLLALDSYPDSATVNYYLAYFALETGRTETAKRLNERALELLETDTSEELSRERKAEMREFILKDLESLR